MDKLKVLAGAAMVAACLAPSAHADEWTKLTYFTFSGPVQMPGMTLPAGTYRFELADPDTSRRVVRVSEKDGSKIQGIFLSIANEKLEPADEPVVMFKEAPAGAPEAIKAWFYPGERNGYEFVYPHDQALKIARANHESVLSANGEVTGTTVPSETSRLGENDRVASADEHLKDSSAQRPSTTTASAATTTPTGATTTPSSGAPTTAAAASGAASPTPAPSETATAQSQASATPSATAPAAPTAAASTQAAPTETTGATPAPQTATTPAADQRPSTAAAQPSSASRTTTGTVGTTGQSKATPAPTDTARQATPAPAAPNNPRGQLPNSGSLLPLFELLSGLSIGGAFGVRRLRKVLA